MMARVVENTLSLTLENLSPGSIHIEAYTTHGQLLTREKISENNGSLSISLNIPLRNQLVILRVSHNQQVKTKILKL